MAWTHGLFSNASEVVTPLHRKGQGDGGNCFVGLDIELYLKVRRFEGNCFGSSSSLFKRIGDKTILINLDNTDESYRREEE